MGRSKTCAASSADYTLFAPFHFESPFQEFAALQLQFVVSCGARAFLIGVENDRSGLRHLAVVLFGAVGRGTYARTRTEPDDLACMDGQVSPDRDRDVGFGDSFALRRFRCQPDLDGGSVPGRTGTLHRPVRE